MSDNNHSWSIEQTNFVDTAHCSKCGRNVFGKLTKEIESEECYPSVYVGSMPAPVLHFLEHLDNPSTPVRIFLQSVKASEESVRAIHKSTERIYKPLRESGKPYL